MDFFSFFFQKMIFLQILVNLLVFMSKSSLRIQNCLKKIKNIKILAFFFENAFTKIGIKKKIKFETKKLQKYVIFDVSLNKTLF